MEYIKIGSIVRKISSGGTPKSTKKEYYGGNIPWLNTKEINFNRIYKTEKYITEDGLNNSSAKYIKENCVIVAMYGATAGRVAINKIPLTTNQACCNIEVDENKMDYNYLYYAIKNDYEHLASFANGGAQQNLNSIIIKEFEIPHFDIKTQKKISKILTNIDKKIELNNEINNNLYNQMEALYKEYFIDNIKKEEWKKTNIYEIANIIYGAPFKSSLFNTNKEGTPIVRIRDLKNQEFKTYTTEKHPKGYLIQKGDIVVGMDGEFRPYIWGNDEAWLNQRVCVFENIREKGKAFLYYTIKPLLMNVEMTEAATTVIHIGKNDFDKFEINLPPEELLIKYDTITTEMINKIINNISQNKILEKLRDTLLPKLMNGEIDLDNIEI